MCLVRFYTLFPDISMFFRVPIIEQIESNWNPSVSVQLNNIQMTSSINLSIVFKFKKVYDIFKFNLKCKVFQTCFQSSSTCFTHCFKLFLLLLLSNRSFSVIVCGAINWIPFCKNGPRRLSWQPKTIRGGEEVFGILETSFYGNVLLGKKLDHFGR